MSLVIPAGFANFTLTITNAAGGASGVSSVSLGANVSGGLVQADVARIANLLRDGLTPRYDNSWTMGPTHVIWNDGGTMRVFDDSGTEAGTHAGQSNCPPGIALVVSKNTGLVGARHRGRLYMPGLDENSILESGLVDGTELNAWQTSFNSLYTSLNADASIDALDLFHDESTPGSGTPDVITGFTVRNVVGSMRPRQRR